MPFHNLRGMDVTNKCHSMEHTMWILKYAIIKRECSFLYFFCFVNWELILAWSIDVLQIMQLKVIHPKVPVNASENVWNLFFLFCLYFFNE